MLVRYVTYSLLFFFALYPVYKLCGRGTPLLVLLGFRKRYLGAFIAFNVVILLVPSIARSSPWPPSSC